MAPIYPGPAYRIRTPRLLIRCYEPTDAERIIATVTENVEHLRPWMPWIAYEPQTLQQRIEFARTCRGNFDLGTNFVYGIFDREDTRLIGGTGLHPRVGPEALEIGYWITQDLINQGLATEVTASLTKIAFEVHQVRRAEIHCDVRNGPSAAVPRKLGYTHEASLRQHTRFAEGIFIDTMIWTLLQDEYPDSPAAAAAVEAYDAINRRIL